MSRIKALPQQSVLLHRITTRSLLLDQPNIGHLQLILLTSVASQNRDVSVKEILQLIYDETGIIADMTQLHGVFRKLKEAKLVEETGLRKDGRRGAPASLMRVTSAGLKMINDTWSHHRLLAEWCNKCMSKVP